MLLPAASVPALEVSAPPAALTGLACIFRALPWNGAPGCNSARPDAGCWVAKSLNRKHVLDTAGRVFLTRPSNVPPRWQTSTAFPGLASIPNAYFPRFSFPSAGFFPSPESSAVHFGRRS